MSWQYFCNSTGNFLPHAFVRYVGVKEELIGRECAHKAIDENHARTQEHGQRDQDYFEIGLRCDLGEIETPIFNCDWQSDLPTFQFRLKYVADMCRIPMSNWKKIVPLIIPVEISKKLKTKIFLSESQKISLTLRSKYDIQPRF